MLNFLMAQVNNYLSEIELKSTLRTGCFTELKKFQIEKSNHVKPLTNN